MPATASMDEFEAMLNESLEHETPKEGTVVKGKVIAVENGQAIIDVGFKVEGRVGSAPPGRTPRARRGRHLCPGPGRSALARRPRRRAR